MPGEKGKVSVTVDIRGKLGKIAKTVQVYSNDPKKSQITLVLTMKTRDVLHAKKHNANEIFKKPCTRCHVDEGRGKKGSDLFNSDCAVCHNYEKIAAPVNIMQNIPDDKLRKNIEEGVDNSLMPAWAREKGGMLTSEDIDSLIEFIKGRK